MNDLWMTPSKTCIRFYMIFYFCFCCLMPLSEIFQLYHDDGFVLLFFVVVFFRICRAP